MKNPTFIQTAVCLLTTASVFAAPDSKSVRQVRFLAVGDSPPYRQEVHNGVRTESPPPADSVPPREIIAGSGKKPLPMRLNMVSPATGLPGGEDHLVLRRAGENQGAPPWLDLKCPVSGDLLVCLFRDPAKPNWKDTLSLVVPDGTRGFPAGTVRIVNLHTHPAQINWSGETIDVPAGGSVLQSVKSGASVQFQVNAADASGKMKRYFSGMIDQKPDERGLVAIYRADQANPRRPVKVLVLREKVTPPSP